MISTAPPNQFAAISVGLVVAMASAAPLALLLSEKMNSAVTTTDPGATVRMMSSASAKAALRPASNAALSNVSTVPATVNSDLTDTAVVVPGGEGGGEGGAKGG